MVEEWILKLKCYQTKSASRLAQLLLNGHDCNVSKLTCLIRTAESYIALLENIARCPSSTRMFDRLEVLVTMQDFESYFTNCSTC